MNINTEFLQSVVRVLLTGQSAPDSTNEAEPSEPEWVEVGHILVFYRYGQRHCHRTGRVIATSPETQRALVEYYNPGDGYWYVDWIGVNDIHRVIGKAA